MDSAGSAAVHIGLNALAAGPLPAGVGHYIEGLLLGFEALGVADEVTVVTRNDSRLPRGGTRFVSPGRLGRWRPVRIAWEQLGLPGLANRLGFSLIHGAMHALPLRTDKPCVVTVHDMTFHLTPDLHHGAKVRYFRWMTAAAVNKARRVVAISEATRRDIIRLLDVPPEKVTVVPDAIHPRFRPIEDTAATERILSRYGLARPYLICVGVIEPRKNLVRLLEAFEGLRRRGAPHKLVIAGKPGWGWAAFRAALDAKPELRKAVALSGYVPDDDLPYLLGAADALVYPSLYEGFGLPVAEAMACGTPVVTSAVSSLPEVAGDAAMYVDPLSVESIESGVDKVLSDRELADSMTKRGIAQAQLYAPERTGKMLYEVYRQALG